MRGPDRVSLHSDGRGRCCTCRSIVRWSPLGLRRDQLRTRCGRPDRGRLYPHAPRRKAALGANGKARSLGVGLVRLPRSVAAGSPQNEAQPHRVARSRDLVSDARDGDKMAALLVPHRPRDPARARFTADLCRCMARSIATHPLDAEQTRVARPALERPWACCHSSLDARYDARCAGSSPVASSPARRSRCSIRSRRSARFRSSYG